MSFPSPFFQRAEGRIDSRLDPLHVTNDFAAPVWTICTWRTTVRLPFGRSARDEGLCDSRSDPLHVTNDFAAPVWTLATWRGTFRLPFGASSRGVLNCKRLIACWLSTWARF